MSYAEDYKRTLEEIASHRDCPRSIYKLAADALCWARMVTIPPPLELGEELGHAVGE